MPCNLKLLEADQCHTWYEQQMNKRLGLHQWTSQMGAAQVKSIKAPEEAGIFKRSRSAGTSQNSKSAR